MKGKGKMLSTRTASWLMGENVKTGLNPKETICKPISGLRGHAVNHYISPTTHVCMCVRAHTHTYDKYVGKACTCAPKIVCKSPFFGEAE